MVDAHFDFLITGVTDQETVEAISDAISTVLFTQFQTDIWIDPTVTESE